MKQEPQLPAPKQANRAKIELASVKDKGKYEEELKRSEEDLKKDFKKLKKDLLSLLAIIGTAYTSYRFTRYFLKSSKNSAEPIIIRQEVPVPNKEEDKNSGLFGTLKKKAISVGIDLLIDVLKEQLSKAQSKDED